MDVQFVNPVIAAVLNVLKMMARIEPKPGTPKKKDRNAPVQGKNVTGLISMVGNKASASIALTFTENAILHIAKNMLPTAPSQIDGVVIDLAGELANMVLGSAKTELDNKGFTLQLSLPTIIMGTDYLIAHKTKAPIITLPFTMPEGDFFLEVSYEDT